MSKFIVRASEWASNNDGRTRFTYQIEAARIAVAANGTADVTPVLSLLDDTNTVVAMFSFWESVWREDVGIDPVVTTDAPTVVVDATPTVAGGPPRSDARG